VQIGKENLSRPHHVDFGWLRLLDFHDHVGSRKDDPRVWRNFGARSAIIVIAEAYFTAGLALDDHLMPVMAELLGRRGDQSHAIFVALYLLGDTNAHMSPRMQRRERSRFTLPSPQCGLLELALGPL
jgi:hypothetical protein